MNSSIYRSTTHASLLLLTAAFLPSCGENNAAKLHMGQRSDGPTMSAPAPSTAMTDSASAVAYDDMEVADRAAEPKSEALNQSGEFNREQYDAITENDFLSATSSPLSTFAIDVDAASYSNTRRFISEGRLPPRDAVRIEELINYFTYDYPEPYGEHPFSITTDVAVCPWNREHKLVQIGLQGKHQQIDVLPPSNLVFLIDVSGSMDQPDKLPLLKSSFHLLVDQLREQDRVAIVVYAGAAGLVLPSTTGAHKDRILDAMDDLQAGGSTAGAAGIELAYRIALDNFKSNGNNRVILATDGDFNVGPSSIGELVQLIEQKRDQGIFLSVLGFGTENLQDATMEQIADKGNGHYAYIDGMNEARKVFVSEIGATLFAIAKDVKIQVEFNPALVKSYRLVGYENRALKSEDFNDDRKDAGELGAGHSVTALYEIVPTGAMTGRPAVDPLKYQSSIVTPSAERGNELMTVKLRYKRPKESTSNLLAQPVFDRTVTIDGASTNLRFSAAVAAWGMLLRGSQYRGTATFDDVLRMARGARGRDAEGYRAEFIELVERSSGLATHVSSR